jgi:hypothetical protein
MKTYKLFWIPRVLTILFILLVSVFAFDAFTGEAPFIQELGRFVLQLIPTSFALIITLLISWRKPLIGGIIFILWGLAIAFYIGMIRGSVVLYTISFISFPAIVIGALFIIFHNLVKKSNLKRV